MTSSLRYIDTMPSLYLDTIDTIKPVIVNLEHRAHVWFPDIDRNAWSLELDVYRDGDYQVGLHHIMPLSHYPSRIYQGGKIEGRSAQDLIPLFHTLSPYLKIRPRGLDRKPDNLRLRIITSMRRSQVHKYGQNQVDRLSLVLRQGNDVLATYRTSDPLPLDTQSEDMTYDAVFFEGLSVC